jgi:hypothetical protein
MISVPRACFGWAFLVLSISRLGATPDHVLVVTERLLGTGTEGFAILRVERDNQGSYYSSGEKHFLDIYEKKAREEGPDIATKVSTVLLVDQIFSRHPDAKADEPPVVTTNLKAVAGETTALPDLLAKFPQMPERWAAEKFHRLEAHPTAGVSIERANLIWGGWVKEAFGVDRNAEFDWKLEEVMEDSNSLFLKATAENQTRWICLLPKTTEQVRARLLMKEFYLVVGSFDTEEAAVALAREINGIRKDKKFFGYSPEVWSERTPADKIRYRVVSGLTEDAVGSDSSSKVEAILGLEIEVASSSRFQDRIFFE